MSEQVSKKLIFKSPILEISGLRLRCILGHLPEERKHKQEITVDIQMRLEEVVAINTDSLEDTLDYAQVIEEISQFVENSSYQLMEALVGAILEKVLQFPKVKQAWVRVEKRTPFALRFAQNAAFSLTALRSSICQS
ncbi:MAG: dihydroneopterin aldolase [Leptospiraceae bacterium]|nr:dihydroneopterin aldolase [Leptospiraceae bacterium]MDW8306387.1 dihydroneopterin aldolase [Leptospiraceae bacterium]